MFLPLSSCVSTKIPEWHGKIWAGSNCIRDERPCVAGVERRQEDQAIRADEEEFEKGLWLSYEDFDAFIETYIGGCKVWKDSMPMTSTKKLWEKYKQFRQEAGK